MGYLVSAGVGYGAAYEGAVVDGEIIADAGMYTFGKSSLGVGLEGFYRKMYRRHLFKLSELEPESAKTTWHTATEYDTYLALRLSYRYALQKSWEVSAGFSVGAHLFKTNYKDEGVIPQKKTDI